jgi:Na+-transporting NADH:ubiquinone oxidoreductase subunit NqrF
MQIFKTWREYFLFRYLNESTLDPAKNYNLQNYPQKDPVIQWHNCPCFAMFTADL